MTCALRFVLAPNALLFALTITAPAQQPAQPASTTTDAAKSSLVGEALAGYTQTKKIIVAAAETMPPENFSFKPTPEIRSYAELFTHVAQVQTGLCAVVSGGSFERKPPSAATSKDEVIAVLMVAGAGHNSLLCAAYLAKAGYKIAVLEGQPIIGGGVKTAEVCHPGFKDDLFSSAHVGFSQNPVMKNDELKLRDYGYGEYIEADPVMHIPFIDGAAVTIWRDLDRTCETIARISKKDANTYRRMVAEYKAYMAAARAAAEAQPGSVSKKDPIGRSVEAPLRHVGIPTRLRAIRVGSYETRVPDVRTSGFSSVKRPGYRGPGLFTCEFPPLWSRDS
jgi:hypothetical protein